ncbi:PQQ-binding-like beta-propeller repeat protein [Streptomyces sp. NBC_00414]|uniref:outer membrane protein assembly factor BamB family protein n=1 Tax=Streptomyces sp. NBC_00414 TaxID=2975739 RepID=UPI002E1E3241
MTGANDPGKPPKADEEPSEATGNPPTEPGRPRSRDKPLFLVLGLVLIVLPVVLLLFRWYEERDLVTGAQGPFPASSAAGPVAPAHVRHQTTDYDEVVVHGLGVRTTDTGVKAVYLRTGKEYWRYERRDGGDALTTPAVTGRTVAIWYPDGRLVAIDLRTGEPRWHTKSRYGKGYQSLQVVGGRIVTDAEGHVRAFSEDDGKHVWTLKEPSDCTNMSLRMGAHDQPDHLSVVEAVCNRWDYLKDKDKDKDGDAEYTLLLGIDDRTGDVLWKRRTAGLWTQFLQGDEDTLVGALESPEGRYSTRLLDVNREGVRPRSEIAADAWDPVDSGSGIVLSSTDPKNPDADHDTALDAYDTRDGHHAWRLRAPSGQQFGAARIADGRVYVVRHPVHRNADRGNRVRGELLVLDADSGRLLHTLRLTPMTVTEYGESAVLDVWDVADGVATVQWRDETEDELVVTD